MDGPRHKNGCEIGVHGIDAWYDARKGRDELKRIAAVTGHEEIGVRMHWLWSDEKSARLIEEAGYAYDSTVGYNDNIGFRSGTTQAYLRPPGAQRLLELPINIQDGALFFSQRLGLSEDEAWHRCEGLVRKVIELGGVLNVIWHDRSPGPERYWGDFYSMFVKQMKATGVWFATAMQVVRWFRKRRKVTFETFIRSDGSRGLRLPRADEKIEPPLVLRTYRPVEAAIENPSRSLAGQRFDDIYWSGEEDLELNEASGIPP